MPTLYFDTILQVEQINGRQAAMLKEPRKLALGKGNCDIVSSGWTEANDTIAPANDAGKI
jgi:hypothetical protein